MYKRVLFISAHFCSATIPAAGHRLAASMLSELVANSQHVDVVTFYTDSDRAFGASILNAENISVFSFRVGLLARLAGALRYMLLPVAASSRKFLAKGTVSRLISQNEYDYIFVDFTQTLEVLPKGFVGQATVRVHDVFTQLYRRQREVTTGIRSYVGKIEYIRAKIWEPAVLTKAKSIIALNSKDANLINDLTRRSDVVVDCPRGYYVIGDRTPATIIPGMILFWGNMARAENIDAVEHFVHDIMPYIKSSIPTAHLIVGGANPPKSLVHSFGEEVKFTGFVDSPGDLFRSCALGVVPLRQGAGIKVKTLELLASNIPTVSTLVGAEGVDLQDGLYIARDNLEFGKMCVEILCGNPPGRIDHKASPAV